MANQFAPSLDDGDHWLPSDIFLTEMALPSTHKCPYQHFSCMEDLATHFAALSLLKKHRSLTPPSPPINPKPPYMNLQSVKMAVRDHSSTGYLGFNGGDGELSQRLCGYGNGSFLTRSQPLNGFQVQTQRVDGYLLQERRPRVLRRQANHIQNRVYPFRGNGYGLVGGSMRESGGTGVFHPRIVKPKMASSGGVDVKRKQDVRIRQLPEIQVTTQPENNNNNHQNDCYYHLPPEMDLPQDWTY